MRAFVKPLLVLAVLVGGPVAAYFLLPRSNKSNHLDAAKAAIGRRDFAAARKELDVYLAARPKDRQALLLAARTARRAGDGPATEPFLSRYLDAGGDAEEADLERVLRRTQDGDPGGAAALMRFCADHPDNPATGFVLEALGRGFLKARVPVQAVTCFDQWLKRDLSPADRAQGLVWRGQALEMLGRNPEAAGGYRAALALDPAHPEARLRLAEFLTRDDPAKALPLFESLDQEAPGRFEVRLGVARCRRQLGDLPAAAALLDQLRAERPGDAAVLTEAGAVALDRGRPAEAEPLLREAVRLAPDRRDPTLQLVRCLHDQGKTAEEREQLARLKTIDDDIERKLNALAGKP